MPIIPEIKVQRLPAYGGADTVLNGRYAEFGDGEWGCIEWTLPQSLSLTSAIVSLKNWQPGDFGFTTIANPMAMWPHAEGASAAQPVIDLGPNALIPDPQTGITIANLYDPAHPVVGGADVWIEIWQGAGTYGVDMKRAKTPGLRERRKVASVSGSLVTLTEDLAIGIGDPLTAWDTILIPEYSTGYSPDKGCANPFLEGDEKTQSDDLDAKNLSGGLYFIGDQTMRLGSPDRSEATEEIPAGLCLCIRCYGARDTGGTVVRAITMNFEMRGVDTPLP